MRRSILLLAPLLLAAAPATQPSGDERPATLAEAKAHEEAHSISEFAGQPVINAGNVEEILKLSIQNNDLLLDTSIKPVESAIVRVPHLAGLAHVKYLAASEPGKPIVMVYYDFEIRDYTVSDAISSFTSASYAAGMLTLSQMWERLDDEPYSVQLLQNPVQQGVDIPHVRLYVQITSDPPTDLKLSADSVVDLRRKYPAEVAKYVDPMFTALHQDGLLARVDPRLAWQVFGDAFVPPAGLGGEVQALVAKLDAETFRDRQAASHDLEALGEGAALVLMHMDRKGLSDEQLSRIDAVVAKFKVETDAHVDRLRRDRDFLIDCLYSDNATIRAAALAQLRLVTGRAIEFDVTANPVQRQAAIDRLRQTVGAPTTSKFRE